MKTKNNFIVCLAVGIILGVIFHKLALGMIFGMAIGVMLDARAAKQNAQDKSNADEENKDNIGGDSPDVDRPE